MMDRVVDRVGDPMLHAAGVVGTTIGSGAVLLGQQVQSGWSSDTSVAAGVFGAGASVVIALWRAMRADQARADAAREQADKDAAEMRRAEDQRRQAELEHAHTEIAQLRERERELIDRLLGEETA